MLMEISCEKFNKDNKKINFHAGLNVVLGDDDGTNSIGKSTFLMIIDFVFGGDDYINKCQDVHKNVGDHEIKFVFLFDQQLYAFGRNTNKANWVIEYDRSGEKRSEIKIDDFKTFLKEKYNIDNPDLSFRGIISPHFRVYQRENYNEYSPLQTYSKEANGEKCVLRLIKLYNLYESIKKYTEEAKNSKESLDAYQKAQKKLIIPRVTKKRYKENKKNIEKYNAELEQIACNFRKELLELENLQIEKTIDIKNKLSILRSKITRYKNKINSLSSMIFDNKQKPSNNLTFYDSLRDFFPTIDVEKLSEVDTFHSKISDILNTEITEEIKHFKTLVTQFEEEEIMLSVELDSYVNEKDISKKVLKKIEQDFGQRFKLEEEIKIADDIESCKEKKKQTQSKVEEETKNIVLQIQNKINNELATMNESLYSVSKKPPILSLESKKYEYKTFDDGGTGTNFKNLIILDTCLLKQTVLPAIIHDSLLLKNIADEQLENIVKLYLKFDKQIFIAFDKLDDYPEVMQELLSKTAILNLGPDEKALFGFTWNNIKDK